MSELIGIAITRKIMGKMEEIESANVSISSGIEGDARGKKRNRQITILFEDDWYDACKDIDKDLHWTKRRANLFVKGMRGPQKAMTICLIMGAKGCSLSFASHVT